MGRLSVTLSKHIKRAVGRSWLKWTDNLLPVWQFVCLEVHAQTLMLQVVHERKLSSIASCTLVVVGIENG